MDDYENIYKQLNSLIGECNGQLSILEEQIDIDLQAEYFDYSSNYRSVKSNDEILHYKDEIFSKELTIEDKKQRFVELASVEEIEAFRTIEKYLKQSNSGLLYDWAVLAYQESRMLIESKLLDENQVFISTGLGGKDGKLRYFIVLLSRGLQIYPVAAQCLKQRNNLLFTEKQCRGRGH
ncbi:MAG: hypothetical protein HC896_07880 [Bacteroidales bacterium]|nr:hypothetical protein [Bacteroidales bacterium]